MLLRVSCTVSQRCKHHAHCNSGRLGRRTIMSPSELMSTRCPGRLYMNRNLPERGTVSCSEVGGFSKCKSDHNRVRIEDHVIETCKSNSQTTAAAQSAMQLPARCKSPHLVIDDIPQLRHTLADLACEGCKSTVRKSLIRPMIFLRNIEVWHKMSKQGPGTH